MTCNTSNIYQKLIIIIMVNLIIFFRDTSSPKFPCNINFISISNGDILSVAEVLKNENGLEITKEYSEL